LKKLVVLAAVAAASAAFIIGCKPGKPEPKEKVEVSFHVMSQCPFGVQVENGIKPALDQLGKAVDFKLNFIGQEAGGVLSSMHGDAEVKGNLLHICAAKHAPEKYMDVVVCMNEKMREIPGNFDECAKKAQVDAAKIKTCADGEEGKKLLSESFKLSQSKQASGSPTIFVAGKPYNGGRKSSDFLRAICAEYKVEKPVACSNIPQPKKVDLTVLTDARCKDCNTDRIINRIKSDFPGLQPKVLDYSTPEGKALYQTISGQGVKMLPAFLFAKNVTEDEGYKQIEKWLKDVDQFKMLKVNGKFDPNAEICDNKADDNADGKIDCDDATCKANWMCLEKRDKPVVEAFVMSHCPFGTQIEKGLLPVANLLKGKADISVKFCDYAMHGEKEVKEQLNQVCIQEQSKDKYMAYLDCFLEAEKSDECMAKAKVDKKKLETCVASTDKKFNVIKNIEDKSTYKGRFPSFDVFKDLTDKYEVKGSPTLVINGVTAQAGRSPQQILDAVCLGFKNKPKECETKLSDETPSAGFGKGSQPAGAAPKAGGCGA